MTEEQKKEKSLDSWWVLLLQQNTTEAFWSLEWNFMVKQTNSNIRLVQKLAKGGLFCALITMIDDIQHFIFFLMTVGTWINDLVETFLYWNHVDLTHCILWKQ